MNRHKFIVKAIICADVYDKTFSYSELFNQDMLPIVEYNRTTNELTVFLSETGDYHNE